MIFEQYQLACLSLSSYLVGDESSGRAVVIDPQRDIAIYLDAAREADLTIEKVVLTHFHADYVSGHLELAAATGAEICFGPSAEADFPIRNLADGERIELGEVTIEAMATPGHTPESISLLVYEHATDQAPAAVCTGDTLFVGDVGRPDLLGAIGYTAEELGRQLYGSINRLKELPSTTKVYPGHGAGSACGKQLGSAPFTTIGDEMASNYALQPMEIDDFVAIVTEGQPAAPAYFLHDAITNRKAHAVFDENRELDRLDLAGAVERMANGAILVDTRGAEEFAAGHLHGAINVNLDGRFAEQVGAVVSGDADIIVAGRDESNREAMVRLGRIGFDRVVAEIVDYERQLADQPTLAAYAERLDPGELPPAGATQLVDVRNPGETSLGFIADAHLIPLAALPARARELDPNRPTVVYCAGGGRSAVAASWLRASGFRDVVDLRGGYDGWKLQAPSPS
jgi:glyoxylase-like metal-dependent hydrolase (beta-lactamase superfamily II)/rhodanese-related sulfurtransferase